MWVVSIVSTLVMTTVSTLAYGNDTGADGSGIRPHEAAYLASHVGSTCIAHVIMFKTLFGTNQAFNMLLLAAFYVSILVRFVHFSKLGTGADTEKEMDTTSFDNNWRDEVV